MINGRIITNEAEGPLSTLVDSDKRAFTGFELSCPGSMTVAILRHKNFLEPIVIISVYATHPAPRSAHRLVSDLQSIVEQFEKPRIIVAGDWNAYFGYGRDQNHELECRYLFKRMAALGFLMSGPQAPHGLPHEKSLESTFSVLKNIPNSSKNVSTICYKKDPMNRGNQLDYVFVSEAIKDLVTVTALNRPEEWGISDHCRIIIKIIKEVKTAEGSDEDLKVPLKLLSWNINQQNEAWPVIAKMFSEKMVDIALLQEASEPRYLGTKFPPSWIEKILDCYINDNWSSGYTPTGRKREYSTAIAFNKSLNCMTLTPVHGTALGGNFLSDRRESDMSKSEEKDAASLDRSDYVFSKPEIRVSNHDNLSALQGKARIQPIYKSNTLIYSRSKRHTGDCSTSGVSRDTQSTAPFVGPNPPPEPDKLKKNILEKDHPQGGNFFSIKSYRGDDWRYDSGR